MEFSIETLLYVKKNFYFGIAKLTELAKLAKIAMKGSEKIVRDSKISRISEIIENSNER